MMTKSLSQSQQTVKEYQQSMGNKLADIEKFYNQVDQYASISKSYMNGNITHVNEKFCKLTTYSKEELIRQNHRILKLGYHKEDFYREMWKTILSGETWMGNIKNKTKEGTYFWVKEIIIPVVNSKKEIIEFLAIHIDIKI